MTLDTVDTSFDGARKPRIALMGEFSAGKSTLANILMREALSPTQITATQLPPIWYSHGDQTGYVIDMDGNETPMAKDGQTSISPNDTRAIRIFAQCDILEACDIIDMPGSSDPNISADIWQAMLPLADAVLWCTPATQAWRQSEAAMWEGAPERLHSTSLLILTRIDKILSETDRTRVVHRVQREANGLFRAALPVSLLDAQGAGDDADVWRESGMEEVLNALLQVIAEFDPTSDQFDAPRTHLRAVPETEVPEASETGTEAKNDVFAMDANAAEEPAPEVAAIMPRRVVLKTGGRRSRPGPRRAAAAAPLI